MRRRAVLTTLLLAVLLLTAPALVPKPALVNKPGFSQAVYDRDGRLLRLTLASDEKYRLWAPLSQMPKSMIQATVLQEDRYFYSHPGVNPASMLRAFFATYIARGKRIGGSTITMQFARMRFGINSRTPLGKLEQILRAVQLELAYSKDELLEAYLNTASYGGNIEGVGAAGLVYFKKDVSRLSVPEALSLSVIPQRPAARAPLSSKGLVELAAAREKLLANLHGQDAKSWKVIDPALLQIGVSDRSQLPFLAPHFTGRVLAADLFSPAIQTTLDLRLQSLVERQVQNFLGRNYRLGMKNATALLVDFRSLEVKAYLGSAAYFDASIFGQVDGLRGKRSPGSALKPFIYGLAIDEGLIHPASVLKDTALGVSAYNPENYDREFLGPLSATDALVRSRNVPAIQLANRLHAPGLYQFLKQAGVSKLRDENFYGLALALGGAEVSMEELVKLYAMAAKGGELRQLKFRLDEPQSEQPVPRLLSAEASYLVVEMLRENPRPSYDFAQNKLLHGVQVAWKTGTSFGFRDAWSAGIVGPYVLGVWIGNFDGTPNPNFVGREAAGPLFFSIVDALAADGVSSRELRRDFAVHGTLNLKKVKVCAVSGALPGPHCHQLKETWFVPGKSPIQSCSVHREVLIDQSSGLRTCAAHSRGAGKEIYEFWPSDVLKLFRRAGISRRTPPPFGPGCRTAVNMGMAPLIASPRRGLSYAMRPAQDTQIPFSAVTDGESGSVYWFVNDKFVGRADAKENLLWTAKPGSYVVRAVDEQGRAAAEDLRVEMVDG